MSRQLEALPLRRTITVVRNRLPVAWILLVWSRVSILLWRVVLTVVIAD